MREEARYPDIAGEAAIDGTGSHLLLELCLLNGVPAVQYDQQIIGVNDRENPAGWLVAPDRIARVQMCLDNITRRVRELKQQFPRAKVTVGAETKSNPGEVFGRDDWWGTCDITITAFNPDNGFVYFLEVVDYKDGRLYVGEKNNTQLISYLFGKMPRDPELPPGHVRMTVVQPKTNPVIRYQCSTRVEDGLTTQSLIAEANKMAVAAERTDGPNAPLIPGKHCQWCKANPKRGGHCTANAEKSLQVVESMNTEVIATDGGNQQLFEYISKAVADPKSLTVEQLADLADAEDGLMAAFGKIKEEIEERIEQGQRVPGYAKEPGKGSNIWAEPPEKVEKMLKARRLKKDQIFPPKLISPAQVMKLPDDVLTADQKKKIERDYITHKAGNLTLKKVSRNHQPNVEKDVAQSSTVDMMFAGVPKPQTEAAPAAEVSFL